MINVYGIVDRDFRTKEEISSLEKDGIYCLNVAEVENLFVVPELLDIMERVLACNSGTAQQAKEFIEKIFSETKDSQIALAVIQEMKHQLSLFEMGKQKLTSKEIKERIDQEYSENNIETFFAEKRNIFDSADTTEKILAVFNCKDMSRKIGGVFGLKGRDYPQRVLNLIRNGRGEKEAILKAISKYVPELP